MLTHHGIYGIDTLCSKKHHGIFEISLSLGSKYSSIFVLRKDDGQHKRCVDVKRSWRRCVVVMSLDGIIREYDFRL